MKGLASRRIRCFRFDCMTEAEFRLHGGSRISIARRKPDEELAMGDRLRIMVLTLCCSALLSGCLNYSVDRKFGDYYNTTKTIWNDSCIHRNDWFFDFEFGSLGQTIAYSGVFMAIWGSVITMPVGWCVHEVEKVSLAPVVDTLYLPIDWFWRADYLEEKKLAIELKKKRGMKNEP